MIEGCDSPKCPKCKSKDTFAYDLFINYKCIDCLFIWKDESQGRNEKDQNE